MKARVGCGYVAHDDVQVRAEVLRELLEGPLDRRHGARDGLAVPLSLRQGQAGAEGAL